MKKPVKPLTNEELREYPIQGIAEGWFFRLREVSNGCYILEGIDRWGRQVSRMGGDPHALLDACRADVEDLQKRL